MSKSKTAAKKPQAKNFAVAPGGGSNIDMEFAAPRIPPEIRAQAKGKPGTKWTNEENGRTYILSGSGRWTREQGSGDKEEKPAKAKAPQSASADAPQKKSGAIEKSQKKGQWLDADATPAKKRAPKKAPTARAPSASPEDEAVAKHGSSRLQKQYEDAKATGDKAKVAKLLDVAAAMNPELQKALGKKDPAETRFRPDTPSSNKPTGRKWGKKDQAPAGAGGAAPSGKKAPRKPLGFDKARRAAEEAAKRSDDTADKALGRAGGKAPRSKDEAAEALIAPDYKSPEDILAALDQLSLDTESAGKEIDESFDRAQGAADRASEAIKDKTIKDKYPTMPEGWEPRDPSVDDNTDGVYDPDQDSGSPAYKGKPKPAPEKNKYDDTSLEDLFLESDRIGNKYQTPEDRQNHQREMSKVNEQISDDADRLIPDDNSGDAQGASAAAPPATQSLGAGAKPGSIYGGLEDPLKKRIKSPPPKKETLDTNNPIEGAAPKRKSIKDLMSKAGVEKEQLAPDEDDEGDAPGIKEEVPIPEDDDEQIGAATANDSQSPKAVEAEASTESDKPLEDSSALSTGAPPKKKSRWQQLTDDIDSYTSKDLELIDKSLQLAAKIAPQYVKTLGDAGVHPDPDPPKQPEPAEPAAALPESKPEDGRVTKMPRKSENGGGRVGRLLDDLDDMSAKTTSTLGKSLGASAQMMDTIEDLESRRGPSAKELPSGDSAQSALPEAKAPVKKPRRTKAPAAPKLSAAQSKLMDYLSEKFETGEYPEGVSESAIPARAKKSFQLLLKKGVLVPVGKSSLDGSTKYGLKKAAPEETRAPESESEPKSSQQEPEANIETPDGWTPGSELTAPDKPIEAPAPAKANPSASANAAADAAAAAAGTEFDTDAPEPDDLDDEDGGLDVPEGWSAPPKKPALPPPAPEPEEFDLDSAKDELAMLREDRPKPGSDDYKRMTELSKKIKEAGAKK